VEGGGGRPCGGPGLEGASVDPGLSVGLWMFEWAINVGGWIGACVGAQGVSEWASE
jgi:hypothetical protein